MPSSVPLFVRHPGGPREQPPEIQAPIQNPKGQEMDQDFMKCTPSSFRAALDYLADEARAMGWLFPAHFIGVASEAMRAHTDDKALDTHKPESPESATIVHIEDHFQNSRYKRLSASRNTPPRGGRTDGDA